MQATAYGATTSLQNVGLALTPMAVALLTNREGALDYCEVEILFACLAALGVVIGAYLNIIDAATGGVLNKAQHRAKASS